MTEKTYTYETSLAVEDYFHPDEPPADAFQLAQEDTRQAADDFILIVRYSKRTDIELKSVEFTDFDSSNVYEAFAYFTCTYTATEGPLRDIEEDY